MTASPGDMTYWPSSEWHIAESDGSFSATWSLGVWVDQPHKEMFSDALKGLIDSKSGLSANAPTTQFKNLHNTAGEVAELPLAYQQSMEMLKNLTHDELQETFLKAWMKHISLQGFKNIPTVDCKLTIKSKLKLRSNRSLILWQQGLSSKDKFFFSFGGVLVESSRSSGLLKLVKAINSGTTCSVSDFLKGATLKTDLKSLQILAAAGAFAGQNRSSKA